MPSADEPRLEAASDLTASSPSVGKPSGFLNGIDRTNWTTTTIGQVVEIYSGGTPSTEIAEYWEGDIPWCTPTDITRNDAKYISQTERNISNSGLKHSAAILMPKGSLLLCSRATIGEVKIAGCPIATNQGFKNLICHDNIDVNFMYYLLKTLKKEMFSKANGSTFLEISKSQLASIEIKIPSYIIQNDIANVLMSIDEEILYLTRLFSKYESIKKATVNLLGYAKKGWIRIHVGDLGDWFKGHGVSMKDIASSGIPCTMYGDIYVKYKEFFTKVDYFLPKDKADAALNGQYGDLLFTASGETADEIGKCACYLGDADICIGGDIIVLRPFHEFDCRFLAYLLNSPACKSQKATLGQGDAVVHIKQENLQSIELYIPSSLNEQQAISSNIYSIDKKINSVETNLKKLYNINQSLLQYFFCD